MTVCAMIVGAVCEYQKQHKTSQISNNHDKFSVVFLIYLYIRYIIIPNYGMTSNKKLCYKVSVQLEMMLQNECPFRNDVTKWMSNWKWCYKMSVQSEMMLQNECPIRNDVTKWMFNQSWCLKVSVQSEMMSQNKCPIRNDHTKWRSNQIRRYKIW